MILPAFTIHHGHVLDVLRGMASESVHCVITSPPYWGLRDYGVDGQLGLEKTPEAYVAALVDVFREVRRVLRNDGTLWLNLGDSYYGSWGNSGSRPELDGKTQNQRSKAGEYIPRGGWDNRRERPASSFNHESLKPKDLVGIPWMVAFALRADDWWLRSDIIWSKPNPMPESVTDRPTKSHEYIFLLAKSERYYFDQDAVREPHQEDSLKRYESEFNPTVANDPQIIRANKRTGLFGGGVKKMGEFMNLAGRNIRTVWTITTQPFAEAHFATFPQRLVETCVKAGTSEKGVCGDCGAPWTRLIVRKKDESDREPRGKALTSPRQDGNGWNENNGRGFMETEIYTAGWQPTCKHEGDPIAATVLDPFSGSGTTGVVALRLGRNFVGIELNEEYVAMARNRITQDAPLLNKETVGTIQLAEDCRTEQMENHDVVSASA